MKKALFPLMAVLLMTIAATIGASEKSWNIKLAHNQTEQHPIHVALLDFAKELDAETQGRITVQIFPNAILGNDNAMIEQLRANIVQMIKVSSSFLESFDQTYSVFSIPYLFESKDRYFRVMKAPVIRKIYEGSRPYGFVGLVDFDAGARSFYTKLKPVLSPDDIKGLKFRVMPSPVSIRMMQLLGCQATPLAFGEVYTALQQGLLDGAENSPLPLVDMKHGEVAKHFSYDEHTIIPDLLVVNTQTWDAMSETDRQRIRAAADRAGDVQKKIWQKQADAAVKMCQEKLGVTFYTVDKKPFQELTKPIIDEYLQNPAFTSLIEEIRAVK
jgi:tripartite ATP-independent transporter DctP family solute receptor